MDSSFNISFFIRATIRSFLRGAQRFLTTDYTDFPSAASLRLADNQIKKALFFR